MNTDEDLVKGLMRDLRVLSGAHAVLSALPGGADVDVMLALVQRRAASASQRAETILSQRQKELVGGDLR
ncbi:hypothetical protein [Streptomyces sp. NPDC050804]|uniref:hypothetical protein n=1 Tax=Streptomyces sp. NPDC050804 TaxID=3154745 RepID=UPI00342BF0B0